MRIVYLHQYFTTPEMSGGTRSYEFARRLVQDGHDVHMITSDRTRGGKPYTTREDGIQVTWVPVSYSNHMGTFDRIRSFSEFAFKSARLSASTPADVVFATSTPLTIAIPGIYAKWRRRVPMVFEVRDPWPEMLIGMGAIRNPVLIKMARLFERFAYQNSNHVIALSRAMKEIIAEAGYPESRISVIPNASDIERFDVDPSEGKTFRQGFEWLRGRKLVLYAGTVGNANGVDYLVRVAKQMLSVDPEIRFLVIGSGGREEDVRSLAKELNVLDRNFYMLPPLSKSSVVSAFSATDISLVLLRDVKELWTNSSNKFFDGLAAGKPVVVNNVGWQAELLARENAGFDIDPRDHHAAALKLHEHLSDNDWLRNAGNNAQRLARERFHRDILYRQFERVLTSVARKS